MIYIIFTHPVYIMTTWPPKEQIRESETQSICRVFLAADLVLNGTFHYVNFRNLAINSVVKEGNDIFCLSHCGGFQASY